MSVFDPNKDYTQTKDAPSLYDTVMEVQKVLQEITNLLQTPDEADVSDEEPLPKPKKPIKPRSVPTRTKSETPEPLEQVPNVYDNLFD